MVWAPSPTWTHCYFFMRKGLEFTHQKMPVTQSQLGGLEGLVGGRWKTRWKSCPEPRTQPLHHTDTHTHTHTHRHTHTHNATPKNLLKTNACTIRETLQETKTQACNDSYPLSQKICRESNSLYNFLFFVLIACSRVLMFMYILHMPSILTSLYTG